MARLDRKSGRFNVVYESDEIDGALEGYQGVYGQDIEYFRYSRTDSQFHNVYGEATGVGRVYYNPVPVPVLQVIREEGRAVQEDAGLYWTDGIHVIASFAHLSKTGLTELDIRHGSYLNDRLAYDGRIFRIEKISVLGQIRRRDFIVSVDAVQLKREDIVNDPQFQAWWDGDVATGPVGGEVWVPPTPGGGSGGFYVFTQFTPSATWTITHDLGYKPNVDLEDSDGHSLDAEISRPDVNTVICKFAASVSGKAYLS